MMMMMMKSVWTRAFGIEDQVGPHDGADGPRGSDHGDGGGRISGDVATRGHQAGQEVEDQETAVPHGVFDVVPEDPKEPEIPDQMHPAPMEEHGRDQGGPGEAPQAGRGLPPGKDPTPRDVP